MPFTVPEFGLLLESVTATLFAHPIVLKYRFKAKTDVGKKNHCKTFYACPYLVRA